MKTKKRSSPWTWTEPDWPSALTFSASFFVLAVAYQLPPGNWSVILTINAMIIAYVAGRMRGRF